MTLRATYDNGNARLAAPMRPVRAPGNEMPKGQLGTVIVAAIAAV